MRSPTNLDSVTPPTDHGVDRPGMHTRQRAQWTGTNRPRTYPNQKQTTNALTREHRPHKQHTTRTRSHPLSGSQAPNHTHHHPPRTRGNQVAGTGGKPQPEHVAAAMAAGKRPDPFRTRKLSPPAPRVLPGRPGGRAGHRRTTRNTPGL